MRWIFPLVVNNFKALVFYLPAKALTVSHPVKECMPMSALQTSMPRLAATFLISATIVLVLVPDFWNNQAPVVES